MTLPGTLTLEQGGRDGKSAWSDAVIAPDKGVCDRGYPRVEIAP